MGGRQEVLRTRFFREARVQGNLEHPGIVPVHDVARAPDRRPFFTMRLVEGRTLADLLSERGGTVSERARLLYKLVEKMEACFDELAELEAIDTGHPIKDTRFLDVPRTLLNFRYFAGMADKIDGRQVPVEPGFLNVVKRQPVGVVGERFHER